MSILTKTSRRRTCFEGYSYLQRKVSMSNQLQSQCCKQDPSSDKRLHCTKSSKKGVVADFISYKEAGRHLANTTSKHSHIKVYRQTMKGVCRYIQKNFYWRKEKRCLASITFTKHPFRQSQTRTSSRLSTLSLQKKAIRLNNQGKTMIAKDSFVPLL